MVFIPCFLYCVQMHLLENFPAYLQRNLLTKTHIHMEEETISNVINRHLHEFCVLCQP